jgi:hypothetical protein
MSFLQGLNETTNSVIILSLLTKPMPCSFEEGVSVAQQKRFYANGYLWSYLGPIKIK